ncbi:MAG: ATP-binding protein, partial [Oscillospiraceae bacterium]|nr:ATP-binding protein [Oscillospiraceae bacterium]
AGADRALMDEAFLELAPVAAACPAQSPEYEEYAQLATSALFGILHAVPSLEKLVHLHQKHRRAFGLLRQIIERRSPAEGQSLKRMLEQLAEICQAYQNSTASEEMRLATLDDLQKQFDAGEYTEDRTWRPVRMHLQGLVTAAVARMRDLPRLSIQLYNREITRYDSLFGEVMNSGSQAAQDITLHATSADGSLGVEYKLNRLRAGSRAPFRVSFNLPPEVAELNYTLTLTYSFGGQSFTTRPATGRMAVAEKLPAKLPAAPYPTESIKDYTLSADGKVTSLQLFGREYEKSHLEELVSGPFSNYRDAFVRGFRRAGKTSLLNYLGSYVEFTCQEENVVPLYVSVQDCTDSRIIYDAFINRVMIAAGKVLPTVANPGNAKWEQLRRRWDRGAEDPDYQLSDLNVFFVELSEALDGRKIVLMMDELDTLIKHFEQNENVHNRLLAGLDALLDDMYIHRYVRFILCGSNNLIRYQMDGGILHQAFQRIGTLEVGNLSYTDIKAMLTAPEKTPAIPSGTPKPPWSTFSALPAAPCGTPACWAPLWWNS